MIYFYSGTPGSGKSLQVAKDIVNKLTIKKQNVIANIRINTDEVRRASLFRPKKKKMGRFYYLGNQYFTPDFFYKYAAKFHKKGQEGQTLIVIDEAQMLFSSTVMKIQMAYDRTYRYKWLEFFTQHRHLGFNIIIVSQFDKLIDPQIRCLFEFNVIHRKVNNFKIGWVLSIFKISLFCAVHYWYGVRERMCCQFYTYSKKYSRIYDSYKLFDEKLDKQSSKVVNNSMN